VKGKYNLANVNNLDPIFRLSGIYSISHIVDGMAYHLWSQIRPDTVRRFRLFRAFPSETF
jgi:hypothetical protein